MVESKRSLSDVFGDAGDRPSEQSPPDAPLGAGLGEFFRRIDEEALAASPSADPDPGAPAAEPVDAATAAGAAPRRRPTGRSLILAGAAAALVGAVATVAVVASQAPPSSPDDRPAFSALASAEAALAEAEQLLEAANERVAEVRSAADADADRADALLLGLAGFSDEAARTTALAAVAAYRADSGEALPSEEPAPYERPDGELTADDVTAALDDVEARRERTDDLLGTAAAEESKLLTLHSTLIAARDAFLSTIPSYAEVVNAENPQAEVQFRSAVTAAAASVAAPDAGDAAVQAYLAAVTALRADQARAVEAASGDDSPQPPPVEPAVPVPPPAVPPPSPEPTPEPEPSPPPTTEPTP